MLKFKYFGQDEVIFHEYHIRKQKHPFEFLWSMAKREAFMADLNKLVNDAEFTIVSTVIDKPSLQQRNRFPDNPYDLTLTFCMERAFMFLENRGQHERNTHIIVERRGTREDNALELTFHRIRSGENRAGTMPGFHLVFADRKTNAPGLQIADLTARPVGLHVLRPDQPNRVWEVIEKKLYRDPLGAYADRGLKHFP